MVKLTEIILQCVMGKIGENPYLCHKYQMHQAGNNIGSKTQNGCLLQHNPSTEMGPDNVRIDMSTVFSAIYITTFKWTVSLHCRWNPASSALLCDWKATLWKQEITHSALHYTCANTSLSRLMAKICEIIWKYMQVYDDTYHWNMPLLISYQSS